jgi:hypothetical protein
MGPQGSSGESAAVLQQQPTPHKFMFTTNEDDIHRHANLGLTRGGFILVGLLCGGNYDVVGISYTVSVAFMICLDGSFREVLKAVALLPHLLL